MPTCEGGYKAFKIGELFDVRTSKSIDKDDLKVTSNNVSSFQFIGRTSVNNGIQAYTEKLSFLPNPANTFSVIQVGESVMQFRDAQWYSSQNIFLLSPLDSRLITCKLYVIAATNKALTRFNGGDNDYPTLKSLKDLCITLPTLRNGAIDFVFMERWVRGLEEERMCKLKAYLQAAGFGDCTMSVEENEALKAIAEGGYKAFKIGELFDATTGNTDIQKNHIDGFGEYVISSGTYNNGIIGKSSISAKIFAKNTITIDMFGNVYFHPYRYKIVTHARIFSLSPKRFELNETNGLYFVSAFSYLQHLFSYNNMCSWEKIKSLSITLPITASGDIDYAFMETAIRAMEKQCIARLREAFMQEEKVYRQVIR